MSLEEKAVTHARRPQRITFTVITLLAGTESGIEDEMKRHQHRHPHLLIKLMNSSFGCFLTRAIILRQNR